MVCGTNRYHASWAIGELAVWRRRAGIDEPPPDGAAGPYRIELAGDASEAAAAWLSLGCPYEAAVALCCGGDDEGLRQALAEFQRLGARAAAAIAARRLRERAARGVARVQGRRPSRTMG